MLWNRDLPHVTAECDAARFADGEWFGDFPTEDQGFANGIINEELSGNIARLCVLDID
jgi:hypothetical protein